MKKFSLVLGFMLIIGLVTNSRSLFAFADGDGTSGNPYQVATADHLNDVRNYLSSYFIQIADIDLDVSPYNTGSGWEPIGNSSTNFTGSYNGQGHTIDGLFINRASTYYVGLFGYTAIAEIDSIDVTNVDITGGNYVGGLVGYNNSFSTVGNSYATGSVTGEFYVGGLVGYNSYSTVSNSYATSSVTGTGIFVGGLVGYNEGGTVGKSYATGSVTGDAQVGGLVGFNDDGTVENSFWDTETSGQSSSAGGTGKTTAEMKNVATFTDLSTVGLVSPWDFVGNPYDDTGYDNYWDVDGSINDGYPFLSWQVDTSPIGDGTSGNPYQIATLNNLYWIPRNPGEWGKYYIQTADIDASFTSTWDSGNGFTPIGNSDIKFTGSYNGQGHTIDGLFINRASTDYVGLFGNIGFDPSAEIYNIGVTNVDITGNDNVGGLVGWNFANSTISNCYATGSVTGNSVVGGLVGINYYMNSTISNCYATVSVTGNSHVGGLVGGNYNSTVSNSYATGSVTGGSSFGGLVGWNNSTVENSFWDTETSGRSSSASGTGKTTAEMKTESTFTSAGWDFTSPDNWDRVDGENGGYPHLSWQTFPHTVTFTDGSGFSPISTQGETNQPIGRFALHADASGSTLDGVWITLNGTRSGASNFKLWFSSDNSFASGSDTQLGSTVATDPGDSKNVWFTGLSSDVGTSDGYYFLTCDVAADASGSIQGVIVNDEDMMLGFSISSTSSEYLSSGDASLPVELSSFTAENWSGGVLLKWITESEIENLGFNIYCSKSSNGQFIMINNQLIPGAGNSSSRHEYEYIDNGLTNGIKYWYKLEDVDYSGNTELHGPVSATPMKKAAPSEFCLYPNYPNPFNPVTTISYDLPEEGHVELSVYNIRGERVKTLLKGFQEVGSYQLSWDGRDQNSEILSSGIYLLQISTGNYLKTNKMVFIR
ncbi:MAG: T9SS type A sorting domain-containing protein [Candidatus Marinimicrobia bacterium]|nr:T9SS type A sorting domain-containing protein [Candidatus Neomarinimicrobiota bacterium]